MLNGWLIGILLRAECLIDYGIYLFFCGLPMRGQSSWVPYLRFLVLVLCFRLVPSRLTPNNFYFMHFVHSAGSVLRCTWYNCVKARASDGSKQLLPFSWPKGSNTPDLPVFRIHDILGWIRIRGSMPLTNGSGSGSWTRVLLFSSLTFKMQAKN